MLRSGHRGARSSRSPSWRAVLAICASACSSPSSPAATPDAQAVCPGSVQRTAGAACTVEGLVCAPQYPCGLTFGIAHCVCAAGTFQCTDLTDAALSGPTAAPVCPPSTAPSERCPSTESAANMAACTELNLVCSYKGPCGGAQALDQCQCSPASGQSGYVFSCRSPCYPNTGVYTLDSGAGEQDGPAGPVDVATPRDASDAASSPADAADASG